MRRGGSECRRFAGRGASCIWDGCRGLGWLSGERVPLPASHLSTLPSNCRHVHHECRGMLFNAQSHARFAIRSRKYTLHLTKKARD